MAGGGVTPLPLPPGRSGFTPALELSYDSGSGVFGLGWSLLLPSFRRRNDKQLTCYRDSQVSDTFVISGAEDLVPVGASRTAYESPISYSVQRYQPRVEAAQALIERWTVVSGGTVGDTHWRTRTRENVLRIYGPTVDSRLCDPADSSKVFTWYLAEEKDELGNLVRYVYDRVTGTSPATGLAEKGRTPAYTYLKRVQYGNKSPSTWEDGWYFDALLDYGEHDLETPELNPTPSTPDIRQDPFSTHKSGFDVRCHRLCRRVLVFHRFDEGTPAKDGQDAAATLVKSLDLAYDENPVATTLSSMTLRGWSSDATSITLPALTFGYSAASPASSPEQASGMEDLPHGIDFSRSQWVDLDGEGLTGLLTEAGEAWYYKRNEGSGRFGPHRRLPTRPGVALSAAQLADVDGDGRLEVTLRAPPFAGTFTRTAQDGWEGFRPFKRVPMVDPQTTDSRTLDLDGDGRGDLLVAMPGKLLFFQSDGLDGWKAPESVARAADEATGPVLLFSNAKESLFLADMDGDGLTDLVRVRHASICYWPNRGYGRFGARVHMTHAPFLDASDRFDPKRVRLADVDGSGPADLIYIGPHSVRYWSNQSGDDFGEEHIVSSLPSVANPNAVNVADIQGNGTACLTWTSFLPRDRHAPLRYIRLMSEGKPYLLTSVSNGLGRTTSFEYTPSTAFYLADRRIGAPWATRLPFPVQCLSKVTVVDEVTGWHIETTYAYHHGYFDGKEHEFRGFGKVEQWDAETTLDGDLPKVRTVTWFHTGAWLEQATLESAYEREYFNDTGALPVGAQLFEGRTAWHGADMREATRALKGRPLRQEVYAEDETTNAGVPYVVTAYSYLVRRLQAVAGETSGVFLVSLLNTVTHHYERDTSDPRVTQELTIEVDDWGNVLRSSTLSYPRRGEGHGPEQATGVVLVTENEIINDTASPDHHWHIGVPTRSTSWHLEHEDLDFGETHTVAEVDAAFGAATAIPWDDATTSAPRRRRIGDKTTIYADDSTGAELGFGMMGTRALVYEVYQLVFAADQASDLETLVEGTLFAAAGYVESEDTSFSTLTDVAGWWARSGTQTRDPDQFYLPTAFTDPFGQPTSIEYHGSSLFPTSITDALDNTVSATYDLRALAPSQITDPNGNRTFAAFDALGRVTRLAVAGKVSESIGDTLDFPTSEFEYHLDTVPVSAWGRQREAHHDIEENPRWIEHITWSDGLGRVLMEKATAAPAPETPTTPRWVGTGRVVLDNKGNPIKQYEPFYTSNDDFDPEEGFEGVASVITYDPLGRAIRVDLPDGNYRRVTFSPWEQTTWDENDNETEGDHQDTPATTILDVQGRVYKTEELLTAPGDPLVTTLTLDVAGNPRTVTDARGNDIQSQTFDMAGRPILTSSPDAGDMTAFLDVAGQPIWIVKSGDLRIEQGYDELRRKKTILVTEGEATARLVEVNEYGESATNPEDSNLKGKLWRQWDTAGRVVFDAYDFKGNLLSSTRRFWSWRDEGETVTWGDDATSIPDDGDLETETFTISRTFDAMNRPTSQTTPDGKVTEYTYDEAGHLQSVAVDEEPIIEDLRYNARGQRESIEYGNGVETEYTYDEETFRLTRLYTTRPSASDLQDLSYSYDPVGNIIGITNVADDTIYFASTAVTPNQAFAYDALYRLTEATGREKTELGYVAPGDEPAFGNRPDTNSAVQSYTQSYTYDEVGNILVMHHFVATGSAYNWTREYTYEETSNRLLETETGSITDSFEYDARGSMVYLPHLRFSSEHTPNVETDFRDQMVRVELPNSEHYALYYYDANGQRVRKVVVEGGVRERIYVGGTWERYQSFDGSDEVYDETETLHVMDVEKRVALLETRTVVGGVEIEEPEVLTRYQLGNHLGSVSLELDGEGAIISYEEYHPYGTTAWRAPGGGEVSEKRYKYTGMERDEETGLQCHGVRYYCCWLGRWGSADPARLRAGLNVFAYCRGNPVHKRDVSGLSEQLGWAPSHGSTLTRNEPVPVIGEIEDWMLAPVVVNALWNSKTAEEAMQLASIDTIEEVASLRESAEDGVAVVGVKNEHGYTIEYRLAVPTLSDASREALGPIGDDVELSLAIIYAPAPISPVGKPYASPGDDYTHFHMAYNKRSDITNRAAVSAAADAAAEEAGAKSGNMSAQSAYLDTLLGATGQSTPQYGLLWHTTFEAESKDHRARVLLLPLDASTPTQLPPLNSPKAPGWNMELMEFSVIYGGRSTPLQGITIIIDPEDLSRLPERRQGAAGGRR